MIGSKILLVDDEVIFTKNMNRLLNARGYRPLSVNGGAEAIRALEKEAFDVVVLDLKMPGMDGLTTLKEIKKLGLYTQTLILTGHGSIDSGLEAVKLGAYDYLSKPCQIEELVAKIEGAWDKKVDLQAIRDKTAGGHDRQAYRHLVTEEITKSRSGWMERWKARVHELKKEVHALLLAYRDNRVPFKAKIVAALVVAYAVSPIDLIPDFIPILGYLDDLIVLPLGIILAVRMIPTEVMQECRAKAGAALPEKKASVIIGTVIIFVLWMAIIVAAVVFTDKMVPWRSFIPLEAKQMLHL